MRRTSECRRAGLYVMTVAVALCGFLSQGATPVRKTKKKPAAAPSAATTARQKEEASAFVARQMGTAGAIENAAALVPFFEQLSTASTGAPVHILHYGDSHTAWDDWTGTIRARLQSRFGNAGSGFSSAGSPFRGYRRLDVIAASSRGWQTKGTIGATGDGRNGMGGVSLTTDLPGQTISLTVDSPSLRLFYLMQPGGGPLEFSVDGVPSDMIDTEGTLGPGYYEHVPSPGPHQYTLTTLRAAPVRVYGWVADRPSGVTYESMGINGAQISMLLDWDENILSGQLAQRDPALIVLAYGTNEAISPAWTAEMHAAQLGRILQRFRKEAPLAGILVLGPPDCQFRARQGFTAANLSGVVNVERQVALEHGCAFWDWRARMGGSGAIVQWLRAGLAQADHVHLNTAGYHASGELLIEDLMEQYRRFEAAKAEVANGPNSKNR